MKKKFIFLMIFVFAFALISCTENKTVKNIEIYWDNLNEIYKVGDVLPIDDIKVEVIYSDGTVELVNDYKISEYNMNTEGIKFVCITYKNYMKEFSFKVEMDHKLEIVNKSIEDYYKYGEEVIVRTRDLIVEFDGVVINNYSISQSEINWIGNEGRQKVTISYMKNKKIYENSFDINYIKPQEYEDYTAALDDISFKAYNKKISDVHDGGSRQTNYIVCYNESNVVTRNQYGYECAIDSSGKIVEMNTNVELIKGGMVLSGHGTGAQTLKTLKVGEYVFFIKGINTVYVYNNLNLNAEYLSAYSRMNSVYKTYINSNSTILGACKDEANDLYEAYLKYDANKQSTKDDFEEKYKTLRDKINNSLEYDLGYYKEGMKPNELDIKKINANLGDYSQAATLVVNHVGGSRQANEIVIYYSNKRTNQYGLEAAIDKNGYVIEIATNVDIPEGGCVLSGHGDGNALIKSFVKVNDKIIYNSDEGKAYISRNIFKTLMDDYYEKLNNAYDILDNNYNNYKVVYYESAYRYLALAVEEYKELAKLSTNEELSLRNLYLLSNSMIESYLLKVYYFALENLNVETRAFWHTPGNVSFSYDETTYEGLCAFLDAVDKAGFNRMYVNLVCHGTTFYDTKVLTYKSEKYHHAYGEYKDYLTCLIAEAKKRDIEIYAWVMTMNYSSCKVLGDSYYTYNEDGEKSDSLDSTNPKVQDFLCKVYKELAAYDLDGIEHDYIRYSAQNEGFTTYAINKFMTDNDLTGDLKTLLKNDSELAEKWKKFKQDGITESLKKINAAIKEVNSDCKITAAVFATTGAKNSVMQDWMKWYHEGLVDELEPMLYTAIYNDFITMTDEWLEAISDCDYSNKINVGLGPMINQGNYVDYPMQIAYTQEKDIGYSIFYSGAIFNSSYLLEILNTLDNDCMTVDASKEDKLKAIKEYMIEIINGYYSLRDNVDYSSLLDVISKTDDIELIKAEVDKLSNEKVRNEFYKLLNKIY